MDGFNFDVNQLNKNDPKTWIIVIVVVCIIVLLLWFCMASLNAPRGNTFVVAPQQPRTLPPTVAPQYYPTMSATGSF